MECTVTGAFLPLWGPLKIIEVRDIQADNEDSEVKNKMEDRSEEIRRREQ